VQSSNNGTLFHYRSFLTYHIDRKFEDHSLIFEKKGKIVAVFPAAEVNGAKKILHSHPGASYGGFIYNTLNYNDTVLILSSLEEYVKQHGFSEIFFVNTPPVYHEKQNDIMEYSLLYHQYIPTEHYISNVIDIRENPVDQFRQICKLKNRSESYYKKLIMDNNIHFEWKNNFDAFYPILVDNKKRHNAVPTHSLEELYTLDKLMPGHLHLLLMKKEEIVLGGTLVFMANNRVGIIFYNMINYNFVNLQPATLQVFQTIKWGYKQKLQFLDFGISHQSNGTNYLTPNASLIKFKEEFGSFSVIRKVFSKEV